jgi:beta-phosphoglucomutase-like phosphatase (HAD superfamily)
MHHIAPNAEGSFARGALLGASVTIVAFDGLVVDTRPARALAITESMLAEGVGQSHDALLHIVTAVLPGRSLDEAVEAALMEVALAKSSLAKSNPEDAEGDATLRDVVVLRARQAYTAIAARGLPLCDGAAGWLASRVASHGRVILRADSARADVDRLLTFSGLTDVVAAVRCADDPPRTPNQMSVVRSWRAIADRLLTQQQGLSTGTAFECDERTASVARSYVGEVRRVDQLAQRLV